MNCSDAEGRISALVDKELSGAREEEIRAHLEQCSKCRGLYELELSTKSLIKSVEPARTPEGLRDRVVASVFVADPPDADQNSEKVVRPPSWVWRFVSGRSVAFSSAAAAVILVGLLLYLMRIFGGHEMVSFIDSVYAHTMNTSEEELTVRGNYEDIQKALVGDLRKTIAVPDLDDLHCNLEGANTRFHMVGRHCALVRYRGNEEELSHFVICCMKVPIDKLPNVEVSPDYRHASREGINMIFWRCEATETTRCLASKSSVDELVKLAEEIRARSKAILQKQRSPEGD